jgi:succinylglutamate desuccinylase
MSSASFEALPESVRALARADFGQVAGLFRDAGFAVDTPAKGVLTVKGVAS